jgi:hypothetical protein
MGKDPKFDLTAEFILESVAKSSWNGIRSITMVRDRVRLEVNLELAFWIATKRAIEKFLVSFHDSLELATLGGFQID